MIAFVDQHHKLYDDVINYLIRNNYSAFSDAYVIEYEQKERQDKKIIGVLGMQMVCKFEPLIVDNSFTAKTLFDTAVGVVLTKNNINRIEISVPDEKLEKQSGLYGRCGFKFIEKVNRFVKILKDY